MGDPDEYVDALDGEALGLNRQGDAADMVIAQGDIGAADITVLCKFVQGVADAATGSARLVITYTID